MLAGTGKPPEFGVASPFGKTADGLEDFRYAKIEWPMGITRPTVEKIKFIGCDFHGADFSELCFESCILEDCSFQNTVLAGCIIESSSFKRCNFQRTDLRYAGIGVRGTLFEECKFISPKFARTGFHNPTFSGIEFIGSAWKNIDFGAANFQNSKFQGQFQNIMFGSLIDDSLSSFSECDFSNARFELVGFRDNVSFDTATQSTFRRLALFTIGQLRNVLASGLESSKEQFVLQDYLDTFCSSLGDEEPCLISLDDFVRESDEQIAQALFQNLKRLAYH